MRFIKIQVPDVNKIGRMFGAVVYVKMPIGNV